MKFLPVIGVIFLSLLAFAQSGEKLLNQLDPAKLEEIKKQLAEEPLTDVQVQEAIAVGTADKNKSGADIGLRLEDSGQKWMNAMTTSDNAELRHSGFAVRLFSPRAWVSWNAHEAKRSYKPYTVSSATDSDRLSVLRIVVSPDTPEPVAVLEGQLLIDADTKVQPKPNVLD